MRNWGFYLAVVAAALLTLRRIRPSAISRPVLAAFPKLAIARADQANQFGIVRSDGSATMTPRRWGRRRNDTRLSFYWPAGSFPGRPSQRSWQGEALVPLIPLPLRPKRALENYHILWEAQGERDLTTTIVSPPAVKT